MDRDSLRQRFEAEGEKPFRANQILEWVYRHGATTFDEMTNLSKGLRERLGGGFDVFASRIVRRSAGRDGTVKLLLQWADGATTECVMIPDGRRRTGCISSQVGCAVGCKFCASGLDGLQRNLTTGEMVEQVLRVAAEADRASESGPRVGRSETEEARSGRDGLTNVVFMGQGEPLANYDSVLRAVRIINAEWGPNIGARKISISTVGLPKQIRRLAGEGIQVNLALSLHAATDGLRRDLVPLADRVTLGALAEACSEYFEKTGREITLEYVLLAGVNDRQMDAEMLARFAGRFRCNVNLIRYNPVGDLPFGRLTGEAASTFQRQLRSQGINAQMRKSRGLDVDAACGQLRRRNESELSSPAE